MKEYIITMNFSVEAEEAEFEEISEFAEQLLENIMSDDKLIYKNDIEIVGITIDNIDDLNYEKNESYLEDEEFDD